VSKLTQLKYAFGDHGAHNTQGVFFSEFVPHLSDEITGDAHQGADV
jgi:hypothetical protein